MIRGVLSPTAAPSSPREVRQCGLPLAGSQAGKLAGWLAGGRSNWTGAAAGGKGPVQSVRTYLQDWLTVPCLLLPVQGASGDSLPPGVASPDQTLRHV
jgi:hypothetical protein